MATLNQLTEQTLGEINGYVRNQESVTIALNTVDGDDLSIAVDDASAISKGIIEIDDELLYVKKSIAASGNLSILAVFSSGNISIFSDAGGRESGGQPFPCE
jgi:hypothetical protein